MWAHPGYSGDRQDAGFAVWSSFYGEGARMGTAQAQRRKRIFPGQFCPVSLGANEGLFRVGGTNKKGGQSVSVWLTSVTFPSMGGDARLAFHGVDKDPLRLVPSAAPWAGRNQSDATCR